MQGREIEPCIDRHTTAVLIFNKHIIYSSIDRYITAALIISTLCSSIDRYITVVLHITVGIDRFINLAQ